MKVICFNANGIRSAARKGFYDWLHDQAPDFVCIQETKAHFTTFCDDPLYFPDHLYCDGADAVKKGYSGVAIYARKKPQTVIKGLGFESCDTEGRYIQFDYPALSIASIYFPSGTTGEARQSVKMDFLNRFASHVQSLKSTGRALILCGDFNIAHQKIDIKNWKGNQKNSGFLPEERAWMDELVGPLDFVDAFRVLNKEPEQYTWWSNRGQARANNVGWRIDYQMISPVLASRVVDVEIYRDVFFSDHAPLIVNYSGDLCG